MASGHARQVGETALAPEESQNDDVVTGRGISYMKDLPSPTYVGAVAEVEVDRRNGEIRVQRFYVVQDCGQIINPDGVVNQIEGNIIQTASRTRRRNLLFDRSAVTSLHRGTYPILTFAEVPDIIVELIDRPTCRLRARASRQPGLCLPRSRTRFSTLLACGCAQSRLRRQSDGCDGRALIDARRRAEGCAFGFTWSVFIMALSPSRCHSLIQYHLRLYDGCDKAMVRPMRLCMAA